MRLKVIEADSADKLETKFNSFASNENVIVKSYSFQQATQPVLSYVAFITYVTYNLELEGVNNSDTTN
ncbi:MAG: hypothetical protein NC090_06750 [Anaeroplasma bactoclasticum]|nr:hypothetical protein [Anaeroplasma bactoclasticum]